MSNCEKFSVSLSAETLAQMEYLKKALRLNPAIKRSQLIAQIVFDCFASYKAGEEVPEDIFPESAYDPDYWI